MKQTFIRRTIFLSMAALTALATGCASLTVSQDAMEQNTASALGLAKGTFSISNRVNDGTKSSYVVRTNSGKQYNCYVKGSFSFSGREVSEPVCTQVTYTSPTGN